MQRSNLLRAVSTGLALSAMIALPFAADGAAEATTLAAPTTPVSPATLTAPGGPGVTSTWTSGDKEGLGTSFAADPSTSKSHVWYTLGPGTMTEVFYPTADSPQVRDLQYIVADGSGYTSVEGTDTTQQVQLVDGQALEYRQVDTAKNGSYRITKTYATDPDRSSVLISTRFEQLTGAIALHLYVLYNPSLGNADADTGATAGGTLAASGSTAATDLRSSIGFSRLSTGYSGTASDGFSDLMANHTLTTLYDAASAPGNIVQTGEIPVGRDTSFTLSLGFGGTTTDAISVAAASDSAGFADRAAAYVAGWHGWFATLNAPPASVAGTPALLTQYDVALMTLRAHEDKTHPGAFVASLSTPWGQARTGAAPGYHAIWARDLYNTATALDAAGDHAAAVRALKYILNTQEVTTGTDAGLIPHNSMVNGASTGLTGIQFDEIADPAILADQLGVRDAATWAKIKLSADYLVAHGVNTPQERWEEQGGYSPATIAAEIAGLVSASSIALANGDTGRFGTYLATADNWQASVESWTVTHSGDIATAHYERINRTGAPDENQTITDGNGWLNLDARDEIDPSFLELTRLGIKPADDPVIVASVGVVDSILKVNTPSGPMWHRYSEDGYGEFADGTPFGGSSTGHSTGRAWPVLTGERGEYELESAQLARAAGDASSAATHTAAAKADLAAMAASANAGYMIPEQVWDTADAAGFTEGEATDSAAPLAWADAQFVRLAISISTPAVAGQPANVETPKSVAARYANLVTVTFVETASTTPGDYVYVVGDGPALGNWDTAKAIRLSPAGYPAWSVRVGLTGGTSAKFKFFTRGADGVVHWQLAPDTVKAVPSSGSVTFTGTF
ncbi:glycoside hydrolase family 15 protein [Subtercola sp. YIM 133946]|uniref:glycoside hydrolase family 15 protein n=1 Tax=Subtercola sp. YIM 133946 TaxID=3118909 RepID=UPI002F9245FD